MGLRGGSRGGGGSDSWSGELNVGIPTEEEEPVRGPLGPEKAFQEKRPYMPRPLGWGAGCRENMDPHTPLALASWSACPLHISVQCILTAELWGQGRGSGAGAASDKTEPVLR